MSNIVLGALLILLGSGGYMFLQSPVTAVPLLVGVAVVSLSVVHSRFGRLWPQVAIFLVTTVGMIMSAGGAVAIVRVFLGKEVDRLGDIFVVGLFAILCLVAATVNLRAIIRSTSTQDL